MPARGITETRRKVKIALDSISENRAPAAVMEALIIGTGMAATMTPVDTGTLINSQFRRLTYQGADSVKGMAGYTAAYAAAVHGKSGIAKGKPRANGNGNYWDPAGEPEFLTKGFEQSKAEIDAAVKRRMQM